MDQLFAPWRIDWIERTDDPIDGCPFCVLPDSGDDGDARIVARSEHAFVVLNNYPYNPGHVMVIPYVHTDEYAALDPDVLQSHARLKQRTLRALRTAFEPDGLNAGLNLGGAVAGGSIDDHVHEHVVPRWSGDTSFMPVVGDTTVIVEGLSDTYDRLHDAFTEQPGSEQHDAGAVSLPI